MKLSRIILYLIFLVFLVSEEHAWLGPLAAPSHPPEKGLDVNFVTGSSGMTKESEKNPMKRFAAKKKVAKKKVVAAVKKNEKDNQAAKAAKRKSANDDQAAKRGETIAANVENKQSADADEAAKKNTVDRDKRPYKDAELRRRLVKIKPDMRELRDCYFFKIMTPTTRNVFAPLFQHGMRRYVINRNLF